MREKLFRGKRIDNGEWIYGFYVENETFDGKRIPQIISEYIAEKSIIPKTVGQYTGLTDKNGTKIFEGDIVKTKYGRLCKVVWFSSDCDQCWDLIPIEDKHPFADRYDLWRSKNLEVIGNVYDNFELLGGWEVG